MAELLTLGSSLGFKLHSQSCTALAVSPPMFGHSTAESSQWRRMNLFAPKNTGMVDLPIGAAKVQCPNKTCKGPSAAKEPMAISVGSSTVTRARLTYEGRDSSLLCPACSPRRDSLPWDGCQSQLHAQRSFGRKVNVRS